MTQPNPKRRPEVVVIAAVARNGVIGKDGGLAWRDPQDMRHFRDTTMGAPVIMGRKTWDSVPAKFRPLTGRRNLVVTRNAAWHADGAEAFGSLEAALDALAGEPRAFVIGGGELYVQAVPMATELMLTEIDADLEGDTRFPVWDRAAFKVTRRDELIDAAGIGFAFVTYRRRDAADGPCTPR